MSVVRDVRSAIVTRIKSAHPDLKDVLPHPGRYTIDDLKALLRASPACAVSLVSASKPLPRASGQVQVTLGFAAVIITRAGRVQDADDEAIDIAVRVLTDISAWVPALTVRTCKPAAELHAEPLAGDEIDRAGMSAWVAMWAHDVLVGTDAIGAEIDEGHRLAANPSVTINGEAA